jgi:cyanate permease
LLLPPWVIFLLMNLGWRQAHMVLAVLVLVVIVPPVWRVVRNTPEDHGIEPEPAGPADLPEALASAPSWNTRRILKQRNFWVPVLAFLPAVTAFSSIQANLRLYTVDIDINPQSTAFLMSLLSGTMICGKLFFGFMADRVDQRLLYWIAALILGVCMVLLIGRPSYGLMVTISGLLGFAAGGFLPLLGAIVGSRFGPQAFGTVFGLMAPFLTLSALGPPIAGLIRDTTGSYDMAFQLILVTMVPAMLVMTLLRPQDTERRAAANEEPVESS